MSNFNEQQSRTPSWSPPEQGSNNNYLPQYPVQLYTPVFQQNYQMPMTPIPLPDQREFHYQQQFQQPVWHHPQGSPQDESPQGPSLNEWHSPNPQSSTSPSMPFLFTSFRPIPTPLALTPLLSLPLQIPHPIPFSLNTYNASFEQINSEWILENSLARHCPTEYRQQSPRMQPSQETSIEMNYSYEIKPNNDNSYVENEWMSSDFNTTNTVGSSRKRRFESTEIASVMEEEGIVPETSETIRCLRKRPIDEMESVIKKKKGCQANSTHDTNQWTEIRNSNENEIPTTFSKIYKNSDKSFRTSQPLVHMSPEIQVTPPRPVLRPARLQTDNKSLSHKVISTTYDRVPSSLPWVPPSIYRTPPGTPIHKALWPPRLPVPPPQSPQTTSFSDRTLPTLASLQPPTNLLSPPQCLPSPPPYVPSKYSSPQAPRVPQLLTSELPPPQPTMSLSAHLSSVAPISPTSRFIPLLLNQLPSPPMLLDSRPPESYTGVLKPDLTPLLNTECMTESAQFHSTVPVTNRKSAFLTLWSEPASRRDSTDSSAFEFDFISPDMSWVTLEEAPDDQFSPALKPKPPMVNTKDIINPFEYNRLDGLLGSLKICSEDDSSIITTNRRPLRCDDRYNDQVYPIRPVCSDQATTSMPRATIVMQGDCPHRPVLIRPAKRGVKRPASFDESDESE